MQRWSFLLSGLQSQSPPSPRPPTMPAAMKKFDNDEIRHYSQTSFHTLHHDQQAKVGDQRERIRDEGDGGGRGESKRRRRYRVKAWGHRKGQAPAYLARYSRISLTRNYTRSRELSLVQFGRKKRVSFLLAFLLRARAYCPIRMRISRGTERYLYIHIGALCIAAKRGRIVCRRVLSQRHGIFDSRRFRRFNFICRA